MEFVRIDLDRIRVNYIIDDLYAKFPDAVLISQEELDARKSELISSSRQKNFRGKFEIEFLLKVLEKLKSEANQGNYPYFTRKIKVVLSCSLRTIISDLSQYADTPDCLYTYLESLKAVS